MRSSTLNKKLVAAGLSAGLLAGGAAGAILTSGGVSGASAAQGDTTTTTAAPSPPGEAGPDRMEQFLTTTLTPLVQDGSITEEQMQKVIAAIVAARPAGGAGGHGKGHWRRGEGLQAAAEALGMDPGDLREQLRGGATLAEIAREKGVDVQVVIDALVADAKAHLDEKVAAGDLTQPEADEMLARLTERITDRVNDGDGHQGGGGHQGD